MRMLRMPTFFLQRLKFREEEPHGDHSSLETEVHFHRAQMWKPPQYRPCCQVAGELVQLGSCSDLTSTQVPLINLLPRKCGKLHFLPLRGSVTELMYHFAA